MVIDSCHVRLVFDAEADRRCKFPQEPTTETSLTMNMDEV